MSTKSAASNVTTEQKSSGVKQIAHGKAVFDQYRHEKMFEVNNSTVEARFSGKFRFTSEREIPLKFPLFT